MMTQRVRWCSLALAIFALSQRDAFGASPFGEVQQVIINPSNPAFGQTIQIAVRITKNGKPVRNSAVELWFSGRHAVQSGHWFAKTDRDGWCVSTATVPRSWINGIQGDKTWVDLNVACNSVGAFRLVRVRGKP